MNEIEFVHISQIRAGDVVRHNGKDMTVGNNNLKRSEFMGVTLWGDSYKSGYQKVARVKFTRVLPTKQ